VACLFSGSGTRHRSSVVSFFLLYVFEKGPFFTILLVTVLIRWEFMDY
jgi:hypothetical protein